MTYKLSFLKADKYEQILAQRVNGISQNLHIALDRHGKLVNDDVNAALIEHARSVIMYERQRLRELEGLRVEINNADKKYVPATVPASRPTYIPKLDEDIKPKPPPVPKSQSTGPPLGPPLRSSVSSSSAQTFHPQPQTPGSATLPSKLVGSSSLPPQSPGAGPSTPSPSVSNFARRDSVPQRPASASATSNSGIGGPPLGGRLVDGTRSMFISHSSALGVSSSTPATPRTGVASVAPQSPMSSVPQSPSHVPTAVANDPLGPLGPNAQYARVPSKPGMGATVQSPTGILNTTVTDPLNSPNGVGVVTSNGHVSPHGMVTDPLSGGQAKYMTQSMRLPNTPARPRLDPREAASKLANMF